MFRHIIGLISFSCAFASEPQKSPPNVVFILVDDTGYNDIGYHNRSSSSKPRIRTPTIDALADAGVKLTNYYVQPICTPTRAALMTGRYPFRYGVTGYTIGAEAPWGIPLNEVFLPEFFKAAGYVTAMFGKWHLGFFKDDYLPSHRGFDRQSGIYNAQADHYTHEIGGGYDWHVNERTDLSLKGQYSGDLVRDDSVKFIQEMAQPTNRTKPFFLYIPFQEAHSPFQVDKKYQDMYPELDGMTERQNLAGMVTHNDDMIHDIVEALNTTGLLDNTILVFSSDNGGPGGQEEVPRPARFDPVVIDRNFPFRGQKHEIYEGGVRVAGFVFSPLLPASMAGGSVDALVHITDWLPTLASATGVSLSSKTHLPLDGHDLWACLRGDKSQCTRKEVVLNFNTVCDELGTSPEDSPDFRTECPAPKAGLRVGDLKILAECYNAASADFTGKLLLYNITADPSETTDLAPLMPDAVATLKKQLQFYGAQAAKVAPLSDRPPWQGDDYFCANCKVGRPQGVEQTWEPWCPGAAGVPCLKEAQSMEYV